MPHASPTANGDLGSGFWPSASPAPEATITPSPGSWDSVHPESGYRVFLLSSGADAPTTAVVDAVTAWAQQEDVDLRTAVVGDDIVSAVTEAMSVHPDLIISAGNHLIDSLAVITANHLEQQFLVVGAELAEPTLNVTSVDWEGASYRGEGLTTSSGYDAASFTPERCASAVRAGTAAVLHGRTGIVIQLG